MLVRIEGTSSGAPIELYLLSQPGKRFLSTVVGLGWAALPDNGTSVIGLPYVALLPLTSCQDLG